VQSADGSWPVEDVPTPQFIRELTPFAKFMVTLGDPVKRMYSDYYFLDDNMMPVAVNIKNGEDEFEPKTALNFHKRVLEQITEFNMCVEGTMNDMQVCACQYCGSDDSC
jgi:hypothetical protein